MRKFLFLFLTISFLASCARVNYTKTKKIEHIDTYFGEEVIDTYQWLEDDKSTNTKEWVSKQNKVTDKYLSKIPFKDQMNNRLTELYDYKRLFDFRKVGINYVFQQNSGLQKQSVYMITSVEQDNEVKPEVLIDPNLIDSTGNTKITLLEYDKDHGYFAVSFNHSGSDWTILKVFDIYSRKFLSDELKWLKNTSVQWYGEGFYYTRYNAPAEGKELSSVNDNQKIYYHKIGTSQDEDVLIFEDLNNSKLFYETFITNDKKYQILNKYNGTEGFETYYRRLSYGTYLKKNNFTLLFEGFESKNRVIGSNGNSFYVLTNHKTPNYKLVSVNVFHNSFDEWIEIIPERDYLLEDAQLTAGKFIALFLKNAHSELAEVELNGSNKQMIILPGLGKVEIEHTDPGDPEFLYSYTSFTQPTICFSGNLNTRDFKILYEPIRNFDASLYESDQVWYDSKDGTKVPMFILKKKGLKLDGTHPTYLYGYGGFGINMTPEFSSSYIALLEQDVVIAIPNLRGGAEFGEKWHHAGMLKNKQNVFDDFISAGEYLIDQKYTSSDLLAIAGSSNGGLLVGACMTQRPELFKVALPTVGVMDMLKYQKFTVGWGWIPEYGSSEESLSMFKYLLGYSPYHNIKKKIEYPATLVRTADHDDRVVPAHSYKFISKLQANAKKSNPSLISIYESSGHGEGKPIDKVIQQTADAWSFFLWNVGLESLILPKTIEE